jgi:hypothetical protein
LLLGRLVLAAMATGRSIIAAADVALLERQPVALELATQLRQRPFECGLGLHCLGCERKDHAVPPHGHVRLDLS